MMNLPGTTRQKFNAFPLLTLDEMETPLCIFILIQSRIQTCEMSAKEILEMPQGGFVETNVWLYEHLRYVVLQLGILVAEMSNVCSLESCPKLELDNAEILCAAHGKLQQCCAIDYCDHVLQSSSKTLNSAIFFPSRTAVDSKSAQHFPAIARRIKRILLHCESSHPAVLQKFEGETHVAERLDLLVGLFAGASE